MQHSSPRNPSMLEQAARDAPDGFSTVFTNPKAGMDMVDKDKVKSIVYEMSKDSAHYANEKRKQDKVILKIARMKQQAAQLTTAQVRLKELEVDEKIILLEAQRTLSHIKLHVDIDAFYASVEELEDPSLACKPVAVGGIGMVCTANYEARKFGVRAAMPGFIAKRLCPDLTFVKPDFKKYTAAAEAVRAVLRRYDPDFVSHGLDEASLDITDHCSSTGRAPGEVAAQLRLQVNAATQLTCSVGIAPTTMLAKICSDIKKPNGQYELASTRDAILSFLCDLPLRKIPGIGKVTEQMLTAFDAHVTSDVLRHRGVLAHVFTQISMDFFLHAALGIAEMRDDSESARDGFSRKGISCERTFAPMDTPAHLEAKLRDISQSLSRDMAAEQLAGKSLTLKVKEANFQLRTRSVQLSTYTNSADSLFTAAWRLLRAELPIQVRLLGIRMSVFKPRTVCGALDRFVRETNTREDAVFNDAEASCHMLGSDGEMGVTCLDTRPADGSDRVPSMAHMPHDAEYDCEQRPFGVPYTKRKEESLSGHSDAGKHTNIGSGAVHVDETSETFAASWNSAPANASVAMNGATCGLDKEMVLQDIDCSMQRCSVCGALIEMAGMQEHLDWHLASSLSSELNGAGRIAGHASRALAADKDPTQVASLKQAADGQQLLHNSKARKRSASTLERFGFKTARHCQP